MTLRVQVEALTGKALCLSKVGSKGVQEKSIETDVVALELAPQVLSHLRALIADLYIPVVESQEMQRRGSEAKEEFLQVRGEGNSKSGREKDTCLLCRTGRTAGVWVAESCIPHLNIAVVAVLQGAAKFAAVLSDASSGSGSSITLRQPDAKYLSAVDARLDVKAFSKAAADKELAAHFAAVLSEWCDVVQDVLQARRLAEKDCDDAGEPAMEMTLVSFCCSWTTDARSGQLRQESKKHASAYGGC